MKTKTAIRQGDVLICPGKIPDTSAVVQAEDGRLIVARGEATGHHHSFPALRGATLFRDDGAGSGGGLYVRTDRPAALEHQEHSALTVPKGTYEIRIQRTFSAGMVRRVED